MSSWIDRAGRRHVGLQVGGRRIHRILPKGASAGDAKRLEAGIRLSLGNRAPSIPGDPLLTDIMGLFVTHAATLRSPDTAHKHAVRIGAWLVGYRVSELRQAVSAFVDGVRDDYAPATINRSLGTLKKALRLAWMHGLVESDMRGLLTTLPEHNARTVYLGVEEVQAIANCASANVRAAIWVALLTGCRRGEICKIAQDDIGQNTIRILAGNTKTLRRRDVPIVSALRPWLAYLPLPINYEGIKSGFRRAREKAGMPHVHFHDLRHSCATILLAHGVDLHTIGTILGHSTPKMTARYAHMQTERQRAAMELAFADSAQDSAQGALDAMRKAGASS